MKINYDQKSIELHGKEYTFKYGVMSEYCSNCKGMDKKVNPLNYEPKLEEDGLALNYRCKCGIGWVGYFK